jgi:capsular exopolysaccharide synthesis family protein
MELRELIGFSRRWAWLLILGAVLGAGSAYFFSTARQTPVYQASTKVMVMQPTESLAADLTNISDIELAETFRSLLTTKPVLDAASERIGAPVSSGQISSRLIEGTLLLQVTVKDGDPQRAALIANALVESLIEQNKVIQAGRFALSEESLQAQISQVEEQINVLRGKGEQRSDLTDEELEARRGELESDILGLSNQITDIELEIENLITGGQPLVQPPEQPDLLSEKQTQLALLKLSSDSAMAIYQEMLPWASVDQLQVQEESVLEIASRISALESEIAILTSSPASSPSSSEDRDLLNELRAERAILQLNLDVANDRYSQFVLADASEASNAGRSPQDESNIVLYEQIYSSLLGNYEAVRLARLQSTPSIVQVERAIPPGSSLGTNAFTNMILGAAAGLLVMGGIALLIEYLDDTLKTPKDIDEILGLPVIGYVKEDPELKRSMSNASDEKKGPYVAINPRSPVAESFRGLRTNLVFSASEKALSTILITSPGPQEGKTTVAINLAAAFSQETKLTLLLDCDLRRPELHKIFGYANDTGLSTKLLDQSVTNGGAILWNESLAVIPSGNPPPNPTELLASNKMTEILERLKKVAEIVVIDSPPSIVSDAVVLSAKVDGVIIVIHPGHTHSGAALALTEQLRRANARVLGVVLNQISRKQLGYYGRYRYEYAPYYYSEDGHYASDDEEENNNHAPAKRRSIVLGRLFGSKPAQQPADPDGVDGN